MASTTPHVVVLQVNGSERPLFEAKTSAAVKPGELLAFNSSGLVAPGGTAGIDGVVAVAVENPYAPDPTASALSQSYANGETARFVFPQSGDLVYAWLKSGQNVALGARLEAATAGQLQAISTGKAVAMAAEAVDASAAAKMIKVRII